MRDQFLENQRPCKPSETSHETRPRSYDERQYAFSQSRSLVESTMQPQISERRIRVVNIFVDTGLVNWYADALGARETLGLGWGVFKVLETGPFSFVFGAKAASGAEATFGPKYVLLRAGLSAEAARS